MTERSEPFFFRFDPFKREPELENNRTHPQYLQSAVFSQSNMADGSSTNVLFDSVRFVLSNWAVLQLAVEHSFGGIDSREKAEWMVDVVDQVLRENG